MNPISHRGTAGIWQTGPQRRRRGTTLLELIAASTVIAVALVPALRMLRDSLRVSRQLEVREATATVAMSVLELEAARVSGSWSMQSSVHRAQGRESGYPNLIAIATSSDAAAQGGSPGTLAVVSVTAFEDTDASGRVDNGETAVTFATKVARLKSYEYEAQGS